MTGTRRILGVDVGSTTVKTVLVDASCRAILWSDYRRHEARQAATLEAQLGAVEARFPDLSPADTRVFLTGSGAASLVAPLGGKFVQEVNAVSMAVESLHPDAGSVIELGGQDAKIIIYKESPGRGARRTIASMNDKCASGTGATIDKCLLKLGAAGEALGTLAWDASRLHHVAAKCGVFAETDIVNLIKSGIPSAEVLCSLADAIVMQNLSVLTRGNTLPHRVVLLGGPNTYLPFLQACWRQRIAEVWDERRHPYPREVPLEELIFVPPHAALYAAFGAAIFGLHEQAEVGRYRGLGPLRAALRAGSREDLVAAAGPPLVANDLERDAFVARYRRPPFRAAELARGATVEGYIGIDGGSTSSKAVLLDRAGEVLCKQYQISSGNPIADTKELLRRIERYVAEQHGRLEVLGVGATGYAADVLEQTLRTDANVVETVAHMMAATRYFDDVDVICDVGGQDIKVLFMEHGQVRNFRLSNQCSAGNGVLLQAMADQFGIGMQDYADVAFRARLTPVFNYGCAVFLDTDRVTFQKEGYRTEELLAGLALVLPKNIWQYVVQIPRLAQLGRVFVLQGGTQYNLAALKAQHDYILERVPGAVVHVHPHCGEAGAIGAALEARRTVTRTGRSSFIGLEAAVAIAFTTRNDESTVCHFCANHCRRTFVETQTPSGLMSRYIAGFSCENGTVESKDELKQIAQRRKALKAQYPNLVQYEAELAFRHVLAPAPLPAAGSPVPGAAARRAWWGPRRLPNGFRRSPAAAGQRRAALRIGMPRVLNMYSTAPLWRAYFETLGIDRRHVVFSAPTSEEMWATGGRYGSIDPCFPAKVVQAHVDALLFRRGEAPRLDYLFFPCITKLPSFVAGMPDSTACPIVAGAPKVIRAAFTKEADLFARAGTEYVDAAVTLTEPHYFKSQMYAAWGERLGITAEENDFAIDEALAAQRRFDSEMQHRGAAVLEALERDNRVGILLLARPYHNDPGLNHDVLEEFQALGYPLLSIRSIPKDREWLQRFFGTADPLSVADVWPEAYSTNSAEKVWAAKFAARHPNLVVLDLSSFKCGNDAPTYGMIDSIIAAGATPYSALHDIDANKPSGSIKIRVRTYEYTLRRHAERLQELAEQRTELERLVAERREALLRERRDALAAARLDAAARRERAGADAAFADYLDAEPELRVGRAPEPERASCRPAEPVREVVVQFRPRKAAARAPIDEPEPRSCV